VGVSRDCPIFLSTPLSSRERVKLRTFNLAGFLFVSLIQAPGIQPRLTMPGVYTCQYVCISTI